MTNDMAPAKTRRRSVVDLALALAVVAGVVVSLVSATATWRVESDVALPFVVWQGLNQYGIGFLANLRFTPDSWLLFPMPVFLGLFSVGAGSPGVILFSGWAIFLACVIVAFLVVRRVAGARPAALAAIVLLFSNRNALGGMGFLTYPVTHNATMLGGLVGLYAAMRWVEESGRGWLVVAALALVATSISDPWIVATFDVPLAAAAASMLTKRDNAPRRRSLYRLLATIVGVIVVYQVAFASVKLLQRQPVHFLGWDQSVSSFAALLRFGGMWFNFLPGTDIPYPALPSGTAITINVILLLAGTLLAALIAVRRLGARPAFDLLIVTGFSSVILTAIAFVLLDTTKSLAAGRYFMASYVFLVMLFAVTIGRFWSSFSRTAKFVLSFCGLLLPVTGFTSSLSAFTPSPEALANQREAADLARFLRSHGLRYGFGGYWGTFASAIAWETDGAVIVRPVDLDDKRRRFVPRLAQTAPLWFTPKDPPRGQKTAFLLIGGEDGCEIAADACIRAAEKQFGPPVGTLRHGGITILLYDYLLLSAESSAVAAHQAPLPPSTEIALTNAENSFFLGDGWSYPEPTGTWTDGKLATILLRLPPDWTGAAKLTLTASAFAPGNRHGQNVDVTVRGHRIAQWRVSGGGDRSYSVTIPAGMLRDRAAVIELGIPGAISPKKAGQGRDKRKLGIKVRSLRVDRVTAPDASRTS